jgi:hypothetical protein
MPAKAGMFFCTYTKNSNSSLGTATNEPVKEYLNPFCYKATFNPMIYDYPPPFDAAWFRFVLGYVVGAILGSFATMLAYRLPRHQSIVFPRSRCPTCKTILGVRDLVPIFSWLTSRGHCRHCHAKIGAQYLYIELATSFSCATAAVILGFTPWLAIAYAAIVVVVVALSLRNTNESPPACGEG